MTEPGVYGKTGSAAAEAGGGRSDAEKKEMTICPN